ncbi:beta galactosidase jelly roll domain-containing protein [Carboxylicivirga marina]|uniref:Beta galactosidase jelly roll domain-containing protein n=1 Tax=Carboxylicivirga marina TaxID=2800988 RepID=A0ABS1HNA0_9BACT|nr:beta galactosidase jelly roll domain-containing protein [Carboxylicivirga marina]MBK3518644.1 beta galactosidase jelly roll domain-containing protein [Carboxylicivirga marina]
MIAKTLRYFTVIGALLLSFANVNSQVLQEEQSLEGHWKFSIGDNEQWKNPDYDDSHWQHIRVPDSWESQGYSDYNGFAWYRKTIRLDIVPSEDLILIIGSIDDADEVYINGRFVGRTGGLPPHTKTAYNQERRYLIPQSYWQKGSNLIAIRVYDLYNNGGIMGGPVTLNSNLSNKILNLNLAGNWKFAVHNQAGAHEPNYDDSNWSSIEVPAYWKSAGWPDYDGVAWYRKSFTIPHELRDKELILLVGKIDDEDKTWFNGTRIGGVSPSGSRSSLARGLMGSYQSHRTLRAYKIPDSAINYNGTNTIAVRVVDTGLDGGIYEGPVGIMTKEQYKKFEEIVRKEPNYFDVFWEWLNN